MNSFSQMVVLGLTLTLSQNAFARRAIPAVEQATAPETSDAWTESGLRLSDFLDANVFQCETNATYAFACVEALNALAGNLDTPVIFALAEELESNPIIGKQIKAYPSGLNPLG